MEVSREIQEHYERAYSGDLAEWRRIGAVQKSDNVRRMCSSIPHGSVLEVGCGDGALLEQLSDFGEVRGLEISERAVQKCRAKGLAVEQFDGSTIAAADASIELVILSHVVEHLEHPRVLLHEAARVGRHVFVEVPLEDNLGLPGTFSMGEAGHINFYSPKTIRLLLQSCGLQVLSELITNQTLDVYRFRLGKKGVLPWIIKSSALSVAPAVATRIWTYHCSLLAKHGV